MGTVVGIEFALANEGVVFTPVLKLEDEGVHIELALMATPISALPKFVRAAGRLDIGPETVWSLVLAHCDGLLKLLCPYHSLSFSASTPSDEVDLIERSRSAGLASWGRSPGE